MSARRLVRIALTSCLLLLPAASAQAATLSVGFSADPTEDEPVTVTVSGTTEVARQLYVLRTMATTCQSNAWGTYSNTSGVWLTPTSGDAVNGSFSNTYTFTPTEAGTYRICAYIAQSG